MAFIGDAVFESFVRKSIVLKYNGSMSKLNKIKVKYVCCEGQSEFIKKIMNELTPEEVYVYKRGRNAHVKQIPKHSSVMDYHRATGLECLFGYLYILNKIERIEQLLEKI